MGDRKVVGARIQGGLLQVCFLGTAVMVATQDHSSPCSCGWGKAHKGLLLGEQLQTLSVAGRRVGFCFGIF